MRNILEISHLCVGFPTLKGEALAVNDVSLNVPEGKIVGIVGESGCGKSMTARSVMGLIRYPGRVISGSILLDGRELVGMPEKEKRALRGSKMSMIFQEPMTSLNPVMKVGRQVEEAIRIHDKVTAEEAARRSVEILTSVGVPEAKKRCSCYPHQLSGGLRQRVMIAMAMILGPRLLIADEPTTALDVTVEAQILQLMRTLSLGGTGILLISHDLGVIAQLCDHVYVMYAGRMVESADVAELFDRPLHPYTRGLLNSVRSLRGGGDVLDTIPGAVPNLTRMPAGCGFSPRCPECRMECRQDVPRLIDTGNGHLLRCCLAEGEAAE
ncbi:MAG: ABC transporter ATP-binding protein [Clostridia bacterium]|nr:ABC transporter ATP-binding protein [Clostridia bacterium]